jgi:imidazolonepropionase-like amidohydrolase
MGVMDVIRQAFTEAEEYRKQWQAYEAAKGSSTVAIPPRRDLELEALAEILEGERWIHSHCYRADEILQLMLLAEEFGIKIGTLQHVLEGYKVADEIAAHGAGASTFSDWWGYKVEAYEAIPYNAALMTERGVVVSINSDSGEEMRHLNQEAAKAIKWGGLSEVEALALVTLNPAKQLLIDDRVGSIEVGKDADLVLYDGHPLEVRSVPQKTFVDGDLYFDLEADRARQAMIDEIKAKLAPADAKEKSPGEDAAPGSAPSPEVVWQDEHYSCREDEHAEEGR